MLFAIALLLVVMLTCIGETKTSLDYITRLFF
jgi:hypothetical protein